MCIVKIRVNNILVSLGKTHMYHKENNTLPLHAPDLYVLFQTERGIFAVLEREIIHSFLKRKFS
jgi:hypothetical protein